MNFGGGGGFEQAYGSAASQFAGGGFMASHVDASPGQRRASGPVPETMRSMTVGQLKKVRRLQSHFLLEDLQATSDTDGQAMYAGAAIRNITIVGVVRTKTLTSDFAEFRVYDGTGAIAVSIPFESEEEAARKYSNLQENMYVRVHGHWRSNIESDGGDLPKLLGFAIRPVEDHNEVVFHNLEVIMQHLFLTRGPHGGPGAAPGGQMPAMQGGMPQQMAPAQQPAQGPDAYTAVLDYLRSPAVVQAQDGAHMNQLVQALGGQFSQPDLRRAVDKAMSDGHCYSTADDNTFKAV